MKVLIETHGCKLNMADSQRLARELTATGLEIAKRGEIPEVFVMNSCTVTQTADSKARQAVSAARRKYPGALIVMTGCMAERDEESANALETVDLVVTNRQKPELARNIAETLGIAFTPCADGDLPELSDALLGRTRASVKIQEGCDQVCAYCIVPKVRGRERSIPVHALVNQVNELAIAGCSEVILTGTQLGTYGFDLDSINLAGMLSTLVSETDIPRIRVSSLQPLEITDELLAVWNDHADRLCPHFHIPLQSGSDEILEAMRRRYTADQFLSSVDKVRSTVAGASVTTDVICGFPGETDHDHEETIRTVELAQFADAHVFPYSVRPGTSAVHLDSQVNDRTRAERAARVREITTAQARRFRERSIGEVRPTLWEKARGASGLTDNYLRVRYMDSQPHPVRFAGDGDGFIEDVRLVSVATDGVMLAEPV